MPQFPRSQLNLTECRKPNRIYGEPSLVIKTGLHTPFDGVDAMKKYSLVVLANAAALAVVILGSTLSAQELVLVDESTKVDAVEEQKAPLARTLDNGRTSKESLYLRHQQNAETSLKIRQAKAQHKAAQRQARIDTAKWYGYSPLRPTVSSLPNLGTYNGRIPAYPFGYTWSYHQLGSASRLNARR
jgi:hypothetical protein